MNWYPSFLLDLTKPCLGVAVATLTIFVRCCFRVAELHSGYGGKLANDEVLYMVLEGAMMTVAVLALTVVHPGPVLGPAWQATELKLWKRVKGTKEPTKEGGNASQA